jgi:hypothetical protein
LELGDRQKVRGERPQQSFVNDEKSSFYMERWQG